MLSQPDGTTYQAQPFLSSQQQLDDVSPPAYTEHESGTTKV